ncbi:MAG: type I-MYXAN CRISPR-associated protein Cas6/Cmx6 [Burkholderiaceae bacterium]
MQSGQLSSPSPGDAVDLSFELLGSILAADYADGLWAALVSAAPWLADEPDAGMHPVRAAFSGGERLLTRRSKLLLRVPASRVDDAMRLCGRILSIEPEPVSLGVARPRMLQAAPTVGAAFVVSGTADELEHHRRLTRMVEELGLPDHLIFGRMTGSRIGAQAVAGSSMVVHRLKPEQSLRLLNHGLGPHRSHGCGLFVPYKLIDGLD